MQNPIGKSNANSRELEGDRFENNGITDKSSNSSETGVICEGIPENHAV